MRISRLKAKNYRTLEDISIEFPADYCTISGHNNAGKSSIIRLLRLLLEQPNHPDSITLNYSSDKTQWIDGSQPIAIHYELCLSKADDASLISFIKKYAKADIEGTEIRCDVTIEVDVQDKIIEGMQVGKTRLTEADAKEILRKLRSSNSLFIHNSTMNTMEHILFRRGRFSPGYPIVLSPEENSVIEAAEQSVQRKIQKFTKVHKEELKGMIGKLQEKYDVEFSLVDSFSIRRMPFDINLKDRSAEVPLDDWGSGTQNRTRILISVLHAKRIKAGATAEEKLTPIVVVEEPESFLHPTAQAEFGALLQALSGELKIQLIASTHSPYMLNQVSPSSNILLRRKTSYKKSLGSEIANTKNDEWMAPFAEHLGVIPPEFEKWKGVFINKGHLLLVEGDLDREYIEYMRKHFKERFDIPSQVEVVAYNGKDALKNSALVKFVLSKVERALITFDLDAASEVRKPLEAIGLTEGSDFIAVGVNKPGRDAIEGLLPDKVLGAVNGRETDLVMQLQAKTSDQRNVARRALKKKYLEEFRKVGQVTDEEIEPFAKLGRAIARRFSV